MSDSMSWTASPRWSTRACCGGSRRRGRLEFSCWRRSGNSGWSGWPRGANWSRVAPATPHTLRILPIGLRPVSFPPMRKGGWSGCGGIRRIYARRSTGRCKRAISRRRRVLGSVWAGSSICMGTSRKAALGWNRSCRRPPISTAPCAAVCCCQPASSPGAWVDSSRHGRGWSRPCLSGSSMAAARVLR